MSRYALLAAAVTVLLAAPADAHNPLEGEFICPLCRKGHLDMFLGPSPFYLAEPGLGIGPELRTSSYMSVGYYWAKGCPHCGYCNTIRGFHLVHGDSAHKVENPLETVREPLSGDPFANSKEGADDQGGENADRDEGEDEADDRGWREYVRLTPAEPLNFPAIRKRLQKAVDPKQFRYVGPYAPERIDIILRTIPDLAPRDRFEMALRAGWACDDCGETQLGLAFRARAIEEGLAAIRSFPKTTSLWTRIATQYQVAEMQLKVGHARGDDRLRNQGRAAMAELARRLPSALREARKRIGELQAKIEPLRGKIWQREKQLGREHKGLWDPDAHPDWDPDGWLSSEHDYEHETDPGLRKLRRELKRLRRGLDEAEAPGGRSRPAHVRDLPLAALEEDLDLLEPLAARIPKELAADTMRDLPLAKALQRARKGTPEDKEGFLMVHGNWRDRPKVRRFIRELLVPLYEPWRKQRDWSSGWPDSEEDTAPPKEVVLFSRYLTALAQRLNEQQTQWIEKRVVAEVLLDRKREALFDPWMSKENVRLASDNAEAIAKALQMLKDETLPPRPVRRLLFTHGSFDPLGDRLFDDSDQHLKGPPSVWRLCGVDAAWSARILLADLLRRPNVYLRAHSDRWFEGAPSVYEPSRVYPGRLIARHVPDQARQEARAALKRAESGKAAPIQAAASLLPLGYLEDAGSLEILREAAASKHEAVRLLAARSLLDRGQRLGLDVLLDESLRIGKAALLVDGNFPLTPPEMIRLLGKKDLPRLRKLWQIVRRDRDRRRKAAQARKGQQRKGDDRAKPTIRRNDYWVLAAMARLGGKQALREYNIWLFRIETQIGDENKLAGYGGLLLRHTPLTARCANLYRALRDAAEIYCTEAAAKQILQRSKLLPNWFYGVDRNLLAALAGNPQLHAEYRRVAADLAPRPTGLETKRALLRYASKIPTPEVTAAIRGWARSAKPELARDARRTLAALEE